MKRIAAFVLLTGYGRETRHKRAGEPLDGSTIRFIRMEREQQEAKGTWSVKRKEQL